MCVSFSVARSFSVDSIPVKRPATVVTVNHAGSTVSVLVLLQSTCFDTHVLYMCTFNYNVMDIERYCRLELLI